MDNKWDKRFLELAKHVAINWSRDPSTKVGAVIVNDKKIVVGLGYNGFPRGVDDDEERYDVREIKYKLVVHAELNAILNANQNVEGCTLYIWPTMMVPPSCPECTKAIIQSGIKKVVCYQNDALSERWQNNEMAHYSDIMYKEAGIELVTVKP